MQYKFQQFGWKPIPSSGFGFDPLRMPNSIREFYERWHAQGGESARDHVGIMKRAKSYPDLRTPTEQKLWQTTEWKLKRNYALMIIGLKDAKPCRLRVIK